VQLLASFVFSGRQIFPSWLKPATGVMQDIQKNESICPSLHAPQEPHQTIPLIGRAATIKFFESIHFSIGNEIWIKASWDLPLEYKPDWWQTKKDGSPVNFVFQGAINLQGFSLTLCRFSGTDEQGASIWKAAESHWEDGYAYLRQLSELGATICFYPNQPHGGISDKHVTQSHLLFYEIDDRSLAAQKLEREAFSEQTGLQCGAVIFSGGKSYHNYIRLNSPVESQQWKQLNRELTVLLNGDWQICNPARAMRLPGMVRRKVIDTQLTQPVEISLEICDSTVAYSPQEIQAAIASSFKLPYGLSDERWHQWHRARRNGSDAQAVLSKPESELNLPRQLRQYETKTSEQPIDPLVEFPLEICLSRDDRELIEQGTGHGSRDCAAFKLAANLIATAERLNALGHRYCGNPSELFDEFGNRCNPPLSQRKRNRIWKSASRRSKKASLSDEQLEKRIRWWQWEQLPESEKRKRKNKGEPDCALYADYREWEKEQERIEQATEAEDFYSGSWLARQMKRLLKFRRRRGNWERSLIGQGVTVPPTPTTTLILQYHPGELPTPTQYHEMGSPRIKFRSDQRLQLWQEVVDKGWQHILDTSAPGQGKSHSAGIAIPSAFGVEKLWYFSADHRNPTTAAIERNYVDLPVRNDGMHSDYTRRTPLGNPFVVWPNSCQPANKPGNCDRTHLFAALQNKNIQVEGSVNPICTTCNSLYSCKKGSGRNSFKGDRQKVLKHNRIRAHLNSTNSPQEFDYSKQGCFVDEASTLLETTKEIVVELPDFDSVMGELESVAPQLHETLKPLRSALRPLLNQDLKPPSRYGWDDAAIRALLPAIPNLEQLIENLSEVLQPNLSFLEKAENIDYHTGRRAGISRATRKLVNGVFRQNQEQAAAAGLNSVLLNWLIPFLRVLSGEPGYLTCSWGKLVIRQRSTHHTDVLKAMRFAIYLDGTLSRERLASSLSIPAEQILHIKQEVPSYGNLKIIHVTGLGQLGKDRSNSLTQRVLALKNELHSRHPDIVFGEWKQHAETGDATWHSNLRGSNAFEHVTAMALFGVPFKNIGSLKAEYHTLTGQQAAEGDLALSALIDADTQASILQALGRPRSHNRPNEEITIYFVGDYDLSFLKEELPGVILEEVPAFLICHQAGTQAQINRWKILEAVHSLVGTGRKLALVTQKQVAEITQVTQSRISQIATKFGGWKALKRILATLLEVNNSDANNSKSLADDELWIAQTYLPLACDEPSEEAIDEVANVYQTQGNRVFLRLLAAMPIASQAKLLSLIVEALPKAKEGWESIEKAATG
jgi:hypothetical protein